MAMIGLGHLHVCVATCMYIHVKYTYMCVYTYMYVHMYVEGTTVANTKLHVRA